MPTNRLVGSKQTVFQPDDGSQSIALHRYVQTVQDTIRPRLAVHEYLKVDGAEVEWMGNSPGTYRFTLSLVGEDWAKRYKGIVAQLQKCPTGILTHPVFGDIRVACQGIEGAAVNVPQSLNSIDVPISFIDASVDTRFSSQFSSSPQAEAAKVEPLLDALAVQIALYASFAVTDTVALLTASARAFADAVIAASGDNAADASLTTKLGTVERDSLAAIDAILADPANTGGAVAYDAVASCEQIAAACIDAGAAYENSKPPLIQYVVASDTDVLTLASLLYGPQASSRVEEIMQLNNIPNPYRITAGTVLLLSSPTLV